MYTQCPECGTVFKVTPDVLRAARGVVRCGVCDATFNAVHSLSDQASTFKARTPGQPPPAAVEPPLPAGLSELHAKVAALQADQAGMASDVPTGRHRALRIEDIDAADDAALEFDAASTDWNTVFVDAGRPAATRVDLDLGAARPAAAPDYDLDDEPPPLPAEPSRRPAAAAYEQLFRTTAAAAAGVQSRAGTGRPLPMQPPGAEYEAFDPLARPLAATRGGSAGATDDEATLPPGRHAGRALWQASPDEGAARDAALGAYSHDDHEDDREDDRETDLEVGLEADDRLDGEPARTAAGHGIAGHHGPDDRFTDPDGIGQSHPSGAASGDWLRGGRSPPGVEPLSITMPEPAPPRRYGWAVALLSVVLAAQVLHFEREQVAVLPVVGPAVQRIYEAAGNPIEPHWSLADYDVRQLGSTGDVAGTLRVLARIQNRAARAQPYPLLRVTILDRFETKIARREFTPAEYLPSRRKPEGLLAADQRVDADLLLDDPGTDAVSFELDLCLYERARLVCAQDARAAP